MRAFAFSNKLTRDKLITLANNAGIQYEPDSVMMPPRHVYMLNDSESVIERGTVLYGPSVFGGIRERAWHAYDIVPGAGADTDAVSLCIPIMDIQPDTWGHVAINGWAAAKIGTTGGKWGMPVGGTFHTQASGMVQIGPPLSGTSLRWVNLDRQQPLWRWHDGVLKDWAGATFASSGFVVSDPDSLATGATKHYLLHMYGEGMKFVPFYSNCPPPEGGGGGEIIGP